MPWSLEFTCPRLLGQALLRTREKPENVKVCLFMDKLLEPKARGWIFPGCISWPGLYFKSLKNLQSKINLAFILRSAHKSSWLYQTQPLPIQASSPAEWENKAHAMLNKVCPFLSTQTLSTPSSAISSFWVSSYWTSFKFTNSFQLSLNDQW